MRMNFTLAFIVVAANILAEHTDTFLQCYVTCWQISYDPDELFSNPLNVVMLGYWNVAFSLLQFFLKNYIRHRKEGQIY